MDTVPDTGQSSGCFQTLPSDSKPSGRAADTKTPLFLGYPLSELQPKKQTISTEMDVTDSLKAKGRLSELTENITRRLTDYCISTGDSITSVPVGIKSPHDTYDNLVLQGHFSALRTITVPHEHFPKSISNSSFVEQFAEHTVSWLQLANTPYAERNSVMTSYYSLRGRYGLRQPLMERKSLGVFYPQDYQAHELTELSKSTRLGLHSLPKYYDRKYKDSFVTEDNGHTPSECLNAFFHGPTIADCASTLLACQYRAIEATIGTDEFNRIFGAPVSKFRIARSLFVGSRITPEHLSNACKHLQPIDIANPLYDLFDDIRYSDPERLRSYPMRQELSEAEIKKGDILYIQGVDGYCEKHITGPSMGFNLICTGQNSSGHNLYLGFDPNEFVQPKTYDQVKTILIDGYNKPQSSETTDAIQRGESGYAQLSDHTLSYNHPIVGITAALRFSPLRWEYFASQYNQAWHQQPPMPIAQALEPTPINHGSPFPVENRDADFNCFESFSSQQESMRLAALKFIRAVMVGAVEARHKKPLGLFLTGSPGIGKTYLCVAVAKKAAKYGINTLYLDAKKVGDLFTELHGNEAQWAKKMDEMLAGNDLVIFDDANSKFGCTRMFLAKAMEHVMAGSKAIMASSNHLIPIKDAIPGFIDPLDEKAHNFFYLGDLQGDSRRSQWWHSPQVQAADALSRLGQYEGCKAAAVIIEQTLSSDDIARALNISVDQIRRVGHHTLPGSQRLSPDYFFRDLSKTQHHAVVLECHMTGNESHYSCTKIEQFLNVIQRVHDEGVKLIIQTNNSLLLLETVRGLLNKSHYLLEKRDRIIDRLNHMFPDFSLVPETA